MNLKINYLSKFNDNKSNNIAVFLKSETKINDLFKIFGKDKHIVTSIEKLKKKENFTKKKVITSIDIDIEKKIWSCVLDFKEADVEFPESMQTFKPYEKVYEEQLAKRYGNISTADIENIELENKTDALWAIADDLREKKNQGEFNTYAEAYRWGATHYTQYGNPITAFKLQRAYHKAKSEGTVD